MPNGGGTLQTLYNATSSQYGDVGTYEEFEQKISDPEKRKLFYDQVSQKIKLNPYEQFSTQVDDELNKKKKAKETTPVKEGAPAPPAPPGSDKPETEPEIPENTPWLSQEDRSFKSTENVLDKTILPTEIGGPLNVDPVSPEEPRKPDVVSTPIDPEQDSKLIEDFKKRFGIDPTTISHADGVGLTKEIAERDLGYAGVKEYVTEETKAQVQQFQEGIEWWRDQPEPSMKSDEERGWYMGESSHQRERSMTLKKIDQFESDIEKDFKPWIEPGYIDEQTDKVIAELYKEDVTFTKFDEKIVKNRMNALKEKAWAMDFMEQQPRAMKRIEDDTQEKFKDKGIKDAGKAAFLIPEFYESHEHLIDDEVFRGDVVDKATELLKDRYISTNGEKHKNDFIIKLKNETSRGGMADKEYYDHINDVYNDRMTDIGFNYLSPEEIEIAKINIEISNLLKAGNSYENAVKIKELRDSVKGIYSDKQLYDPETGKYYSREKAPSTAVRYEEKVQEQIIKYANTDLGRLKELRDDLFFQMSGFYKDVNSQTTPSYSTYEMVEGDDGKKYRLMPDPADPKKNIRVPLTNNFNIAYPVGSASDKQKRQAGSKHDLITTQMDELEVKFNAVNKMLMLNEDVAGIDRGVGNFFENVGGSIWGAFGGDNKDFSQQIIDGYVESAQENGIFVSDEQKKRYKKSVADDIAIASGATLRIMGEIALAVLLKQKSGVGAGITRQVNTLKKLFGNRGKSYRLLFNMMDEGAQGLVAYSMTEESGATGFGEGLTQGALNTSSLFKAMEKTKYGKLLGFLGRSTIGAGTESVQEFVGDFFNEIKETDFNVNRAFKNAFGENLTEFKHKLAVTYTMSLGMSASYNAPNLIRQRKELEKYKGDPIVDEVLAMENQGDPESKKLNDALKKDAERDAEKETIKPEEDTETPETTPETEIDTEPELDTVTDEPVEEIKEGDITTEPEKEEVKDGQVEPPSIEERPPLRDESVREQAPEQRQAPEEELGEQVEPVLEETTEPAPEEESGVVSVEKKDAYVSDDGKYTVSKDDTGALNISNKKGKSPSAPTRRKILREYKSKFDYTAGKKADVDPNVEWNMDLYVGEIAKKSNNPSEIAQTYEQERIVRQETVDYRKSVIADHVGKVKRNSYIEFADKNLINRSMAKSYFNNEGSGVDQVAQEVSDMLGQEVEPQEIVDFITEYPNGPAQFYKESEGANLEKLSSRFEQITGFPLNDESIAQSIDQELAKSNIEVDQYLDQEFTDQLEAENEYYRQIKSGKIDTARLVEEPKADSPIKGKPKSSARKGEPTAEPASEPTGDSVGDIDVKKKDNYDKVLDFLDSIKADTKGTLGINIAPAAWNTFVDTVKLSVKLGKTMDVAIRKGIDALKRTEWYRSLTVAEQKDAEATVMNELNSQYVQAAKETTKKEEAKKPESEKPKGKAKKVKETVEKTTGIKKEPSPFVRMKESTILKTKLKNLERGSKMGAKAMKEKMDQVKKEVRDYAKKNLPKDELTRGEVTPIMTAIAKATKPQDIEAALDRIDKIADKHERIGLVRQLGKMLDTKRYEKTESGIRKGKKVDADTINRIKSINDIAQSKSTEQAINEINATNQTAMDEDRFLTPEEFDRVENLNFADLINQDNVQLYERVNTLNEIIEDGKTKRKAEAEALHEEYVDTQQKSISDITDGKGVVGPIQATTNRAKENSTMKRLGRAVGDYMNMNQSWDQMMDIISKTGDGALQGPMNRMAGDPVNESRRKFKRGSIEKYTEVTDKLKDIYGNKRQVGRALNDNSRVREVGKFKNADGKTETLSLSQNQAYYVYNLMQDPTLDNTFAEMGFTPEMKEAIENYLKPEVKQWADWQRLEFFPKYYDSINEVYVDLHHTNLPFNKNYTPLVRERQQEGEDKGILTFGNNVVSTTNGSLKERRKNTSPIKLDTDGDSMLFQYIGKMEHFKAFGRTLKNLNAIFGNRDVKKAIEQEHGKKTNQVIQSFIDDFARNGIDRAKTVGFVDKLRGAFTTSAIGLNPVVILKQLTSVAAYGSSVPFGEVTKGMADFMANPKKAYDTLMSSEFIKDRYAKGWDRDVAIALAKDYKSTFKQRKNIADYLMFTTKIGDAGAILMGGWGVYKYNYKQAKKQGLSDKQAHEIGIKEFEDATRRSQQAADIEDLSQFQRQGSLGKLFTMFKTSPMQYFRMEQMAIRNLIRGKGKLKDNLRIFAIYHFVLPSIFQFVANGMPGLLTEWDDEDTEDMLRANMIGSLNGLFIAGDMLMFLGDVIQGKPWAKSFSPTPAFEGITDITLDLKEMVDKMNDEGATTEETMKAVKDFVIDAGKLSGLPLETADKLIKNYNSILTEEGTTEEKILQGLGYGEYKVKDAKKDRNPEVVDFIDNYDLKVSDMQNRAIEVGDETRKLDQKEYKEYVKLAEQNLENYVLEYLEGFSPEDLKELKESESEHRGKYVSDLQLDLNDLWTDAKADARDELFDK